MVVAFRSGDALTRCIDSLRAERLEVVVVDNGGGGPEIDDMEGRVGVTVVRAARNEGFGAGCNLGARALDADIILFVNPDTIVAPGSVAAFAAAFDDPEIGVVQARLRLLAEPDLLNSGGNVVHVSGLAWPGGYRTPADELATRRDIPYASGAAFAIRADLFRRLRGFTEELFLYQEDLDLSWRARLAGYRVVVEPGADVLHDYVLERPGRRKEYFLERNRLALVATLYSGRLLLLLAPVLVAVELGLVLVATRERWFREKASGWAWLVRNARWLRARRAAVQSERLVADSEAARFLTPVIHPQMLSLPRGIALVNGAVEVWWRVVRVFL